MSKTIENIFFLTHYSLESNQGVIGKQRRPRSDAVERGVW